MKKFGRLFSRTPLAPPGKAPPLMLNNYRAYHTLAAQKCEAYLDCLHFIEPAVAYYRALRDKHLEKAEGKKPFDHEVPSYYSYEMNWTLCPELVEGICIRYDVTADDVYDWVEWFKKLDFSLDMSHTLPYRFAEVDCFWDGELPQTRSVSFF
jgi:hypothetical protein